MGFFLWVPLELVLVERGLVTMGPVMVTEVWVLVVSVWAVIVAAWDSVGCGLGLGDWCGGW